MSGVILRPLSTVYLSHYPDLRFTVGRSVYRNEAGMIYSLFNDIPRLIHIPCFPRQKPSVYVISDSELARWKRKQAEAELGQLDELIEGHKQSIECLEKKRSNKYRLTCLHYLKLINQQQQPSNSHLPLNSGLASALSYINEHMTEVQLQAALRMKAALLAQSKEKMRDLYYLRKAGSKGIAI